MNGPLAGELFPAGHDRVAIDGVAFDQPGMASAGRQSHAKGTKAVPPMAKRNSIPHSSNPIPRNDNPIPDSGSTIPVCATSCAATSNAIPDNDNGIPDNDNCDKPKFPVLRLAIAVTLRQCAPRQRSDALKFQKNSGCQAERGGISRRSLLFSCVRNKKTLRPVTANYGHHHTVCERRDFQNSASSPFMRTTSWVRVSSLAPDSASGDAHYETAAA